MEAAVNLSQIGLYNPQRQSDELAEKLFVVRQKQLESLMESLNEEASDGVPQHHLILAQRGMGKTTMLKRIEVELHKEEYRQKFIPALLPEEQYGVSDLAKFWLNCLDALADSLDAEKYSKGKINKIDVHIKDLMLANKTDDLNEKLYRYLISICRQLGRRPVLLVDNIGLIFNRLSGKEQHALRGYLSEEGCPIVVSAGVAMAGYSDAKKHVFDYNAPFYDFFQIHYLKRMGMEDFLALIQNLANVTQTSIAITSKELPRLQSLLQLTGGNPRTSVMLFKLLVKGFSAEVADDLEALLDEITPLYKARFEELPTQQQIILDAIAKNWNPMSLKKISAETRLASNQLSPQLKRLIKEGWLETTRAERARGNAYSISERFFSIYHIMRNGSRRSKKQIVYLSKFLECFYGKKYLSEAAEYMLDKNLLEDRQRILALALLGTKIQGQKKAQLKNKIFLAIKDLSKEDAAFFKKNDCAVDVYQKKLLGELYESIECNNYTETSRIITELKRTCSEAEILYVQGFAAIKYGKFNEAEKAFRKIIELGNNQARFWILLGISLLEQAKNKEAIESFNKVIELNPNNIMAHGFMGNAYANMSEWSKAIGCYDKFIELNSKNAVAYKRRGDAYSMVGEAAKAVEDYTKAIELNPVFALAYSDRGWEYAYSIKDYDKAIADYTKAVELDKKSPAKEDLLHLYRDIKNQLDKAEKIFSAIDLPKNEYFLEQTLFELHKRNEGTARKHLLKALSLVEDGFTEDTQGGWVYFAAIAIKLGYGQWLLDILEEKEFDTILSPYFVAIRALEVERTKNSKAAEIYLKNQAVEKSEPARMTIEVMKKYI